MEAGTKIAKFEGGPLHGDAIKLPSNVTEYKTLSLETVLTPITTHTARPALEHQEITYKEHPIGSGYFVYKNELMLELDY